MIVRHSQDKIIPECPPGYALLWDGYSLLSGDGNGEIFRQDLGAPGSCAPIFSYMPFSVCSVTQMCSYAIGTDISYWLSTQEDRFYTPKSGSAISNYISRCAVCESPGVAIAVHSQNTTVPDCWEGWESVWEGYSYLQETVRGGLGGYQQLDSTGSCLEQFQTVPYIECISRGTCISYSYHLGFWLRAVTEDMQFVATQETLVGSDVLSAISRCRVCVGVPS